MSELEEQIKKRRTFAIISHPDAGKTTLTEKFLLYGGAINQAGSVKGRKQPDMRYLTGWRLKSREVFRLHLPFFSLNTMETVLIFWIHRDIRISLKIRIEL